MLMRILLAATLLPALLEAQERRGEGATQLPANAARDVAFAYNNAANRHQGRYELRAGEVVQGDLAVIDGPVLIAGRVHGSVTIINSNVTLEPTARIDDNLVVVGGTATGRDDAFIGGEIRIYRQRLAYTMSDGRVIADATGIEEDTWWRRMERRRGARRNRLVVASTGAYNRVEGLPVGIGPQIRHPVGDMVADLRALAILRTASSFRGGDSDVGYLVQGELRSTRRTGYALIGRAYDVVSPVEEWQISDLEAGLATFLFRRDYRDYYGRHGGSLEAEMFQRGTGHVSLEYARERWLRRELANPWTLFGSRPAWRDHPLLDEGLMNLVTASAHFDSRHTREVSTSGWRVSADVEWGSGTLTALGLLPGGTRMINRTETTAPGPVSYTRGFLDVRRYNRLSPDAQLNLRLVTGGWLGGDDLPLQRRLSVGGVGSIPGHDFRSGSFGNDDAAACNAGEDVTGRPALCDRIALAQVEYRGALHFGMFDRWDIHRDRDGTRGVGWWVMFLNAGRGWDVAHRGATPPLGERGEVQHPFGRGELPPLSSFLSDIGLGLDFGSFGAYVAKSLSHGSEQANFVIRLRHRF